MLSRQEFFETTIDRLIEQRTRAMLESGVCAYRVTSIKYERLVVKKCAIGHHIPDDEYTNAMEGMTIEHMSTGRIGDVYVPSIILYVAHFGLPFMEALQRLHDAATEEFIGPLFTRELACFAETWNLQGYDSK